MKWPEPTVTEQEVKGALGIWYTQTTKITPDGCSNCHATGTIYYSTKADIANYENRQCHCCCCCECQDEGPTALV